MKDSLNPQQSNGPTNHSVMPLIGLGTWKLYGDECEKIVHSALELGYRHIDTADAYQNHVVIGRAIKSYPREQIFVTTKLSVDNLLPEDVESSAHRFLQELNIDYMDLLLIHWPNPQVNLSDTLRKMTELQKQKIVRFIGVSNFVRSHLKALNQYPIFANQIEMHPYLQRRSLVTYCKEHGIAVIAYRPLAKGAFENDMTLQKIGTKYGKSPSQIALRWLIQKGICAIPKASSLKHLKDNFSIFDFRLDEGEMMLIDLLDRGKRFCAPDGFPLYEDD